MKVYSRGDNGEFLMHSDTYLGEDYTSPNLMHWKYIKKERVNGSWRYYYQDDLEALKKKETLKAINNYDKIHDFNQVANGNYGYYKTSRKNPLSINGTKDVIALSGNDKKLPKIITKYTNKLEKKLKNDMEKKVSDYRRYKIKSFPRKVVGKVVAFLKNLFS